MHAQQERPRLGLERGGIVGKPGAVGGAHLDQPAAGLREDLRHAEAAADLHQLAAADHRGAARPQRRQRQHGGARAVVDHVRSFRAEQLAEQRLHVRAAMTAAAGGQVDLEVRIAGGDFGDPRHRLGMERRAAQVGVQDHAGGVDHPAQPRRGLIGDQLQHAGIRHRLAVGRSSRLQARARLRDGRAHARLGRGAPGLRSRLAHRGPREHLVHRGKSAQGRVHACRVCRPFLRRQILQACGDAQRPGPAGRRCVLSGEAAHPGDAARFESPSRRGRRRRALRRHRGDVLRGLRPARAPLRPPPGPAADGRGRAGRGVFLRLRAPRIHRFNSVFCHGDEADRPAPQGRTRQRREACGSPQRRRGPRQRFAQRRLDADRRGRRAHAVARHRGRAACASADAGGPGRALFDFVVVVPPTSIRA